MRRHWQKKPLLVRDALPEAAAPLSRAALFRLVGRDDVESRLVVRDGERWTLRHGPLPRRALPSPQRPGWTLLVQGLDLHDDAARALLERFRFLPDARLDDLMLSWASDGGGVGAHVDSYDVFLLQVAGRRRWRISKPSDPALPARHAAEAAGALRAGARMAARAGRHAVPAAALGARRHGRRRRLHDLLDRPARTGAARTRPQPAAARDRPRRRRPRRPALRRRRPAGGRPAGTHSAAAGRFRRRRRAALRRRPRCDRMRARRGAERAEVRRLVRPARCRPCSRRTAPGVRLDRRSRLLYDERRIYFNGESYDVGGRDARLLRQLADEHRLDRRGRAALGDAAREQLQAWLDSRLAAGPARRRFRHAP